VYGPHVCGESIDFKDDVLYTGSYDIKNQLQAWDTRTFSVINTIEIIEDDISSKVYSLQVQKTGTREKLVVGCKGNSQLLCYSLESFEKLGFVNDSASVYCLDFCHNYNKFAAVTTNHNINIYEMEIIK
jgi:WD40 repeat protein